MKNEEKQLQVYQSIHLTNGDLHDFLQVRETPGKGKGVFTTVEIPAKNLVVFGKPIGIAPHRTRFSFQTDWDLHVILDDPAERLNHSCNPNLGVRVNDLGGYSFISRRIIKKGEELTWFYPTTEYVSTAVKECLCGSRYCISQVCGWKQLPKNMKQMFMREGFVAPFIMKREIKRRL